MRAASRLISTPKCRHDCPHGRLKPTLRRAAPRVFIAIGGPEGHQVTQPRASASGLSAHFAITSGAWNGRRAGQRGASLVEFALVALLLCLLLLVFVDFGRMFLVYNSINNSARAGVRYAIVHGDGGGTRVGSGPAPNPADVVAVVINFAGSAPLDKTLLDPVLHPGAVTVTYLDGSNAVGSLVEVRVTYPYDPLLGYFPLNFSLRGRSQGRVAF
jgi:Flp pilus assembly protein TadG